MEDFSEEPPTDINPYKVLELQLTANPNDVKSAYRKLALRHHPDKAPPSAKDAAHTKFQEIAFAYAILSDERRRKRYDTTGNTSESLDIGDDDFSWSDFFRAQWAEAVTGERLNNFKSTYQDSEEEKRDVLKAYTASKGKLNALFRMVMLSNPLDDEERFRRYIDRAIEEEEVDRYDAYVNESKETRDKRHRKARKEAKEAEEHAKASGIHESIFGNGDGKSNKSGNKDSESALADMIQQRNKSRSATFLDDLEAKYAGDKKGAASGKKGKKRAREDEPPEEAFQKTAEKPKKRKASKVEEEDPVDESTEQEPEPIANGKKVMSKGKKGKKGKKRENDDEPAERAPAKSAARGRTRKTPVVKKADEEEEELLHMEDDSADSEPEVAAKKKALKAKSSKRTKR